MTSISVIIPTYNRCHYLLACLDSVFSQRLLPDEVIVVDDGSTDGTVDALTAYRGVTLLMQKNAGPGAARNLGANQASGKYLVFLDSDDLWFPWSLESLVALIEQNRQPTLLFARFEDFIGDAPLAIDGPAVGRAYPDFLSSAPDGVFAGAGMMVVKRATFLAVRGFTEMRVNAEDHDLALKLGAMPGFVQVTSPVIVGHRVHSGNEMRDIGRTLAGLARLIEAEVRDCYPGGQARREGRRLIITRHVRPAIFAALRAGRVRAALKLYRRTFAWNMRAGRLAFLLVVPVMVLKALIHPARRRTP